MVGRRMRAGDVGGDDLKGGRDNPVNCTVDPWPVNDSTIVNSRIHWIESAGLPSRIKGMACCQSALRSRSSDTLFIQ